MFILVYCTRWLMVLLNAAVAAGTMTMTISTLSIRCSMTSTIPMFSVHLWMMCMTDFLYDGIETVVFVGCIFNNSSGTVWFL